MDTDSQVQLEFVQLLNQYSSLQLDRAPAAVEDPATGVQYKDVTINADNGVSARLYLPKTDDNGKLPVLVYIHGGGFFAGSAYIPLYHNYLLSVASQANVLAVSVEYRLAPTHRLPAAYDDALTAFNWVVSRADPWLANNGDFERLFVAGDSAGANIAHNLTLRLGAAEQGVRVEGMVLMHPYFWGSTPIGSEISNPVMRFFFDQAWAIVKTADVSLDHPWINPVAEGAPSLAGLGCKRAMVFLAEKDPWVHRGRAYHQSLKDSGWDGEEVVFETKGPSATHGFFLANPGLPEAAEVMNKLIAFINKDA